MSVDAVVFICLHTEACMHDCIHISMYVCMNISRLHWLEMIKYASLTLEKAIYAASVSHVCRCIDQGVLHHNNSPLLPSRLQKSVKLSGCWTGMGMALYPSRSWAWQCAPWDTCPVRWSWRLSCNALTWTVSPRCWFFSVTGGGGLSQCIAAHGFGSNNLQSPRKVWRGSCETLPFTTARNSQMTVSYQPPVDKPASRATHAREMEHLLFHQLIQLGEDRPALATFLWKVVSGLLQGCCNLSLCIAGQHLAQWRLLGHDLNAQPSRAAWSCGLTAPWK